MTITTLDYAQLEPQDLKYLRKTALNDPTAVIEYVTRRPANVGFVSDSLKLDKRYVRRILERERNSGRLKSCYLGSSPVLKKHGLSLTVYYEDEEDLGILLARIKPDEKARISFNSLPPKGIAREIVEREFGKYSPV